MKGVLDRIEDGLAVILVEAKDDEFTIPKHELPAGSGEGTWFKLSKKDGNYSILSIDEEATGQQRHTSEQLLKKLQKRKKKSKFQRK